MKWSRSRALFGVLTALLLLPGCGSDSDSTGTTTSQTATTVIAEPAPTQGPRMEKWVNLKVGDCLAGLPPSDPSVVTVAVIDCAAPHAAEVYLLADIEVNDAIADIADQECAVGLSEYTGRSVADGPFAVSYLIDSRQDRTSNNPLPSTVICLLQGANGQPLTGSARR